MNVSLTTAKEFIAGDAAATQEVYLAYRKLLYFVIVTIVGNEEDAKDVYQDVFLNLLSHRGAITDPKNLHSYLVAMAKNAAINYVKKRDSLVEYSSLLDFYGEEERHNSYLQDLNTFLSDRENIVVTYRLAYGFTIREVATLTNVSPRQINIIYSQAIHKLRRGLHGGKNDVDKTRL